MQQVPLRGGGGIDPPAPPNDEQRAHAPAPGLLGSGTSVAVRTAALRHRLRPHKDPDREYPRHSWPTRIAYWRWWLPRRGVRTRPLPAVPSTPADTPAQPPVDSQLTEPHVEEGHGGVVLLAVGVVAAGLAIRAFARSRR